MMIKEKFDTFAAAATRAQELVATRDDDAELCITESEGAFWLESKAPVRPEPDKKQA